MASARSERFENRAVTYGNFSDAALIVSEILARTTRLQPLIGEIRGWHGTETAMSCSCGFTSEESLHVLYRR